ncbi:MAG: lytic transglycosylase domain-containing protein [Gammaproteobacteria bacterium]|nr:lytic transglycosylase domain-containing protein [Gammaproteobacteria bacterium]
MSDFFVVTEFWRACFSAIAKSCVLLLILNAYPVLSDTVSVYKYVDAQGVLHLTSKPPPPALRKKLLYSKDYEVSRGRVLHLGNKPAEANFKPAYFPSPPAHPYELLIRATALKTGVEAALLHAVVKTESAYNPDAISHKGAAGLMQLMPDTAKRYGVTDRSDPVMNLLGGARYLSDLLKLFNYDVSLALAAYNAGENAVIRYGNKIPPYRETREYVAKVMALYR